MKFFVIHLAAILLEALKYINSWNEFENNIFKITATSPRGQWVDKRANPGELNHV